jgi:DSF synthase
VNQMTDVIYLRSPYGVRGTEYEVEFDPGRGIIWAFLNPRGTPCFSKSLLHAIRQHDELLEQNGGKVFHDGSLHDARYYVMGSRTPGVFNMGGDLALFQLLIKMQDRGALLNYARHCIDCVWPRIINHNVPTLTTISLVQGDALGGGFEAALAADVLIAEEDAVLGLPEITFNLFPGMGACSLLARRIGMRQAEKLILDGRLHKARELYEMGVIDVLAPTEEGERTTYEWIRKNDRRHNGMQAVFQSRQAIHPITRQELDTIAENWVEAALRLTDHDVRMMRRLVAAQQRRMAETIQPANRSFVNPLASLAAVGAH